MAAQAPTPKAQPNPQRERWSKFFSSALQKSGMSAAEFVRRADHPGITPALVSQWQKAKSGISAELAIRTARVLGLPATQVLREGGQGDVAAYIDDVAGATGTSAAALEPLIARVRQITSGLTDEQRAALTQELLDQIGNLYLLTEKKADMLRSPGDKGDADRGAS
jgi:transcriptional regulator with XRE-family HTH domain